MMPNMGFQEPLALDLLTEFRSRYGAVIEKRRAELHGAAARFMDDVPTPDLRAIYAELNSLRYFEQELNRVISAFVNEATKPWRDAYASAMMRNLEPFIVANTGASSKASGTHAAAGKSESEVWSYDTPRRDNVDDKAESFAETEKK